MSFKELADRGIISWDGSHVDTDRLELESLEFTLNQLAHLGQDDLVQEVVRLYRDC